MREFVIRFKQFGVIGLELLNRLFTSRGILFITVEFFFKMGVLVYFSGKSVGSRNYLFSLQAYYLFRYVFQLWDAINRMVSGVLMMGSIGKELKELIK